MQATTNDMSESLFTSGRVTKAGSKKREATEQTGKTKQQT